MDDWKQPDHCEITGTRDGNTTGPGEKTQRLLHRRLWYLLPERFLKVFERYINKELNDVYKVCCGSRSVTGSKYAISRLATGNGLIK